MGLKDLKLIQDQYAAEITRHANYEPGQVSVRPKLTYDAKLLFTVIDSISLHNSELINLTEEQIVAIHKFWENYKNESKVT